MLGGAGQAGQMMPNPTSKEEKKPGDKVKKKEEVKGSADNKGGEGDEGTARTVLVGHMHDAPG